MKILVIDEEFPFPLNTGKRIRSFNLICQLAKANSITYLAYGYQSSDACQALMEKSITPIAVKPPDREKQGLKFYIRLLLNLGSRYPYIVASHYTAHFQKKLHEQIRLDNFNLIICEWTPYALFLKNLPFPKKIIVAHNIESSIWKLYEKNERNPAKKAYISIQRAKVERFEKECFHWVDGAIAVTHKDASTIADLNVGYTVEVIDNGVDTSYFKPQISKVEPDHLVFTGSMDWRPNQDAVHYFVKEIFPILKQARPNLKVTFVGREPPKHIWNLNRIEGISVTGTVDDVRPYIAKAAIYIAPLRIGGGSRLKILEAMAMKKPVISTTIGADGLLVEDGKNIILADDNSKFAEQIIWLMENQNMMQKLAENGYSLVNEKYRWQKLSEKYNSYIKTIVE